MYGLGVSQRTNWMGYQPIARQKSHTLTHSSTYYTQVIDSSQPPTNIIGLGEETEGNTFRMQILYTHRMVGIEPLEV